MKYYLGIKGSIRTVFSVGHPVTEQTHGAAFNAVVGPFRTKRAAEFMRDQGGFNPHCISVSAAERISARK